jgi:hypothetical protein
MLNYYVDPAGNDSNPGTLAQPFLTAQHGADVAQPGDTVFFRTGTFAPFHAVRSGAEGLPITFKADSGQSPVINYTVDPDSPPSPEVFCIDLSYCSRIVVDGLTTMGGSTGILTYGGSDNQILNCIVTGAIGTGISSWGGSSRNLIKGCTVYNNVLLNWPRGKIYDRGGIWGAGVTSQGGGTDNIVEDCLIYWNHGEGLSTGIGSSRTIFRRNVIADNWSVNLYVDGANDVTLQENFVFLSNAAKTWPTVDSFGRNHSNSLGIGAAVEPDSSFQPSLSGLKVVKNLVVNAGVGFQAFPEEAGHLFANWLIANNTFVDNDVGVLIDNRGAGIDAITFANNIVRGGGNQIAGNPSIRVNPAPTDSSFISNLYYNPFAPNEFYWGGLSGTDFSAWRQKAGESGSLQADPLLVEETVSMPRLWDGGLGSPDIFDPAIVENFFLQASSPCIDAGELVINGIAYTGANPDMGRYEYGGEDLPTVDVVVAPPAVSPGGSVTVDYSSSGDSVDIPGVGTGLPPSGSVSFTPTPSQPTVIVVAQNSNGSVQLQQPVGIFIPGLRYRSGVGYMPRSMKGGSDLSVDFMEIVQLMPNRVKSEAAGIIIEGLSDTDLDVGRFDHARAELFYVNYNDLSQGRIILPGSGNIGQIKMNRGTHESELRGKTIYLQQMVGDLYSKLCRAVLGDDVHDYRRPGFGCHVRLDPPFWRAGRAFAITDVDTTLKEVTVAGNAPTSAKIGIINSAGNNGTYSVLTRSYDSGADKTTYGVSEAIPSSTADGTLLVGRYWTLRPAGDAGAGSVVKPSLYLNRHFYCSKSGLGNVIEPDWDPRIGAVTLDGTAEWTAIQALTVFGSVTSVLNRRFFLDSMRSEPPTLGLGVGAQIANYAIRVVSQSPAYFEVDGDITSFFESGATVTVIGSDGNDGVYAVSSASLDGARTRVNVSSSIPSASVTGFISAPISAPRGFFAYGKLTFLSGANLGISKEVKDFLTTSYTIVAVDTAADKFLVSGDQTAKFTSDLRFSVNGSTSNDANYDVVSATYDSMTDQTAIEVFQDVVSPIADGTIFGPGGQFELFERMPFDIEIGDQYMCTAGCDLAAATCKAKFDNIYNLRAEVEIPGTDVSLSFPESKI